MTKCVIYGLYSSRDGELRYIGQTTQDPLHRLRQHRSYAKKKTTAVHKWFLRETKDGFEVQLRVIDDNAVFNITEMVLIQKHLSEGARLLNLTDGGEGTIGWVGNKGKKRPDLSERNRASAGKPGHPMSQENKRKLAEAQKKIDYSFLIERNKTNHPWIGKRHSAETKAKIGAGRLGKLHSKESKEKMRLAKIGKVLSLEAIEKLRAGHKAYYARKAANVQ